MSKVHVLYTLAALCLFGALFAAFAIAGLGMSGPLDVPVNSGAAGESEDAASADSEEATETASPLGHLDYPDLEAGRTYRISHRTPIYSGHSAEFSREEALPADGYFGVQASEEYEGDLWYRITVNDGVRDYTMYLLAEDLNFKTVRPLAEPGEAQEERAERLRQMLEEWAARQRRPQRARQPEPPPEPEPRTFDDWWADVVQGLGGATTANLVVAGFAAFLLTVLTVGAIVFASILRRQHAWDRPVLEEDHEGRGGAVDRGSEFYEHDAPGSGDGEGPF